MAGPLTVINGNDIAMKRTISGNVIWQSSETWQLYSNQKAGPT